MRKTWIVVAILLALTLAALDMTIVGTAMPTIISDLHGAGLYSWVFSAYLLTSTTPVPLYGKIADIVGRKWTFVAGAGIFTVGSGLCGLAHSMPALVFFRALQGVGAAGVLPIAQTIAGDVFTVEQRGRIQGVFSSVWGIAAVGGPLVGAYIVEHFSWRWVFFVNVPLGVLIVGLLVKSFHETVRPTPHRIDWLGSLLLTGGTTALLIALVETRWTGLWRGGALGLAVAATLAFIRQQHRAAEPIIAPDIFRNRFIAVAIAVNVFAGMILFSLLSYIPMLAQGVWGASPTGAGLSITPMLVSWPLATAATTRLIQRTGYRTPAVWGGGFIAGGAALIALYPLSPLSLMTGLLIIGTGLGFTLPSLLIGVQGRVRWNLRGSATSSVQFFRTIGGAVGVSAIGAVLDSGLTQQIRSRLLPVQAHDITESLLNRSVRDHLPAGLRRAYQIALSHSLSSAFVIIMALAVILALLVWLIPAGPRPVGAQRKAS